MGAEREHPRVALVIPVLYSDLRLYGQLREKLTGLYGPVDQEPPHFPFKYTGYYDDEMGGDINRAFLSFEKTISPEELPDIKRATNALELEAAVNGRRKVNLDPGYMSLGKFVLATTKDQQHRLYMGKGIYEEITLYYRDGEWKYHDWTYPDYRTEEYRKILAEFRLTYKIKLKGLLDNALK